MAYVVPCVRFNCLVRRFASVTIATLGMNSWLGFIHQGLSPWKKRQASLGTLMAGDSCAYPSYETNQQTSNRIHAGGVPNPHCRFSGSEEVI